MRLKKFDEIRNFSVSVCEWLHVCVVRRLSFVCFLEYLCVFFDVSVCECGFYARVY